MPQITDPALLQELNGQPSTQGGAYPGIIQGRPKPPSEPTPKNPYDIQTDQRDYNRSVTNDLFSNEQDLRKEFYALPAVKEFQVAGRTYANSLEAANDASGDQSLIVAYAKMLDPGSVVREGEAAAVAGADSTIGRAVATLSKELGLGSGGQLSPEIRSKIRREMRTLAENYGKAYDLERSQFEELARSYNFDPNRVVGQHLLDPYRDTIEAYWSEQDAAASNPAANVGAEEDDGLNVQVSYEGPNEYSEEAKRIAAERSQGQSDMFGGAGQFLDAAGTLGKQGITLGLADEAAGVGGAISALLTGGDIGEGYVNNRDAERLRVEQARDQLGWGGTALELAGGGAGVLARGGQVMRAARALGPGNVTRQGVQQGLVREATRTGVGVGALGGFGYGEGAAGSGVNALAGAALGGAVGNAGQRVGNALANRSAAPTFDANRARQVADAGRAENVTVNRAMIDPRQENVFSGVETTRLGGPRVNRAMDEIEGQVADRANALSRNARPEQPDVRGGVVQDRMTDYLGTTKKRAGQLFEQVSVPADTKVELSNTRQALAEITEGMKSNPELSQIWVSNPRLRRTLEALTPNDTRPAGRVKYEEVADSIRSTERDLAELRAGNITVARLKLEAQEDLASARKAFDSLPLESTPASKLSAARARLANAEARNERISKLTSDESGVAALEKELNAKLSRRDEAFVESRQPPMGGELSWKDMKRLRTIVGEITGQPGLSADGAQTKAMRKFYGALSADMEATATARGPVVAQEWRRASDAWAKRENFVENVAAKLLGDPNNPKSTRQAANVIDTWVKGDFARFRSLWGSLGKNERDMIRASVADEMGKDAKGNFAPHIFLNATSGKQRVASDRAFRAMFGDEGFRSIQNLRTISEELNRLNSMRNRSNSARGVNYDTWLLDSLLGGGASGAAGLLAGGMGTGAAAAAAGGAAVAGINASRNVLNARMLTNPRITKWIATAPKTTNPRAIDRHFARLGDIAKAEPALAGDIEVLRKSIMTAANENTAMPLAAGDQNAEENPRE